MIIAAALLSAYFTIASGSDNPFADAETHLHMLSIIATLFLLTKMTTVTLRPYKSHDMIDFIDYFLLPILFMILLLIGSIVIIFSLIGADLSAYIQLGYNVETGLVVVVLLTIGTIYGVWVRNNMAELGTSLPEHSLTVPSGNSGTALPLKLKNETQEVLSPEDILFVIDSPDGVNVKIEPAREIETGVWQPFMPLEPNSQSEIDVRFSRAEGKEGISEERVNITVKYLGETREVHTANLRI